MAEDVSERYHKLLTEFRATKLPNFYQKYSTEEKPFDHVSFKAQHKDSDLFPETLPIEHFLNIPAPIRKRRFFEDISVGHIVEGIVTDKWVDILYVKLHCVYHGPKRWINDLKIKAECDLSEFKTHSGSRRLSDSISDFDIGDHVRGVVSHIDHEDWKLTISFRRSLLPDHLSHTELGAVEDTGIAGLSDDYETDCKSYLEHLRSQPSFENPELANNLVRHLGINTKMPCTFMGSLATEVDPDEFGHKLRERQSTKWSMDMVANGVKLFKDNKHDEALKCFDQALQMHPKNVEALVARGALKANRNMLKAAIIDFRESLEIHPSHRNGRKYLSETLISLAKQHEKERLWRDASRCYKEALEIDPDQEAARERIHQIRIMLSQQVLAGKRNPVPDQSSSAKKPEVDPFSDGLQRSKSLIQLLKKKVSKKSKKKKRKRLKKKGKKRKSRSYSYSNSSSPSSHGNKSEDTESASEKPNSESEDEWVEKTVDESSIVKRREGQRENTLSHRRLKESSATHSTSNKHEGAVAKPELLRVSSGNSHKDREHGDETSEQKGAEYRKESPLAEAHNKRRNLKDADSGRYRGERLLSHQEAKEQLIDKVPHQAAHRTEGKSSCDNALEDTSRTLGRNHFSTDEISFISSLLSKKSRK